jgi:hypothetical protein
LYENAETPLTHERLSKEIVQAPTTQQPWEHIKTGWTPLRKQSNAVETLVVGWKAAKIT